jgi:hypothetical protein
MPLETKDYSSVDHYLTKDEVHGWPPQNDKALIPGQYLNLTSIGLRRSDGTILLVKYFPKTDSLSLGVILSFLNLFLNIFHKASALNQFLHKWWNRAAMICFAGLQMSNNPSVKINRQ